MKFLKNWPVVTPAFVFIDALDATRGGISDAVFRNLIADVSISAAGGASSRPSGHLTSGSVSDFASSSEMLPRTDDSSIESFPDVRHIQIPPWTSEELGELLQRAPQIAIAIQKGGQSLYDLALVPFNTRLLADLISGGIPPEDFGEIGSQVGLLQLYWQHRVERHGTAAELCLRRGVSEMVDGRALRANKSTRLAATRLRSTLYYAKTCWFRFQATVTSHSVIISSSTMRPAAYISILTISRRRRRFSRQFRSRSDARPQLWVRVAEPVEHHRQ